MNVMIRQCKDRDFETIYSIINDAAKAYRGVIPEDRWKEPYMPREELQHEIDDGVVFWGYEADGELIGVAGIQHVQDVTLIRHAYVRTATEVDDARSMFLNWGGGVLQGGTMTLLHRVVFYGNHMQAIEDLAILMGTNVVVEG